MNNEQQLKATIYNNKCLMWKSEKVEKIYLTILHELFFYKEKNMSIEIKSQEMKISWCIDMDREYFTGSHF